MGVIGYGIGDRFYPWVPRGVGGGVGRDNLTRYRKSGCMICGNCRQVEPSY